MLLNDAPLIGKDPLNDAPLIGKDPKDPIVFYQPAGAQTRTAGLLITNQVTKS